MTINKSEVITLPKWLVILVLPMIISLVTAYGLFRANSARVDEKLISTKQELLRIDNSKASKDEFNLVKEQLNRIEKKIDDHMNK